MASQRQQPQPQQPQPPQEPPALQPEPLPSLTQRWLPYISAGLFLAGVVCAYLWLCGYRRQAAAAANRPAARQHHDQRDQPDPQQGPASLTTSSSSSAPASASASASTAGQDEHGGHTAPRIRRLHTALGCAALALVGLSALLFLASKLAQQSFATRYGVWLWQLPTQDRAAILQRDGMLGAGAAISSGLNTIGGGLGVWGLNLGGLKAASDGMIR